MFRSNASAAEALLWTVLDWGPVADGRLFPGGGRRRPHTTLQRGRGRRERAGPAGRHYGNSIQLDARS